MREALVTAHSIVRPRHDAVNTATILSAGRCGPSTICPPPSTRRNNPKVSSAAAVNYLMRIKPTGESGEIVTLNIDDATTGRSFMGVVRAAALAGILAFVLCLASGKLKAMAGEIVPIWIVDGYVVAHVMVASGNKKFAVLVAEYSVFWGRIFGSAKVFTLRRHLRSLACWKFAWRLHWRQGYIAQRSLLTPRRFCG